MSSYFFNGKQYDERDLINLLSDLNDDLSIFSSQCMHLFEGLSIKGGGYIEALKVDGKKLGVKEKNVLNDYAIKCEKKSQIEFDNKMQLENSALKNFKSLEEFSKIIEKENSLKSSFLDDIEFYNNELDKYYKEESLAKLKLVCIKLDSTKNLMNKQSDFYDARRQYIKQYKDNVLESSRAM